VKNDPIQEYYDQNTPFFLLTGSAGSTGAIHREIWAPGVNTREQAALYINQQVKEHLLEEQDPRNHHTRLLDAGCGVGGTMTWLAKERRVDIVGITNSPVQLRIAQERTRKLGLSKQLHFILADFHTFIDPRKFHGVYAIEAFTHSHDSDQFFSTASHNLHPGGRLVISDDFVTSRVYHEPSKESKPCLERVRIDWHLTNLSTVENAVQRATTKGLNLVSISDFSPYLHTSSRIRLWLMRVLSRLPIRATYRKNISGGLALQVCIQRGWISYQMLVFEKLA